MSKKEIHRAQILLEKEQYEQLAEIAAKQDRSVSAVIRELVSDYVAENAAEARRAALLDNLAALTAFRRELQRKHGLFDENILDEIRAERDADMERVWRGEA